MIFHIDRKLAVRVALLVSVGLDKMYAVNPSYGGGDDQGGPPWNVPSNVGEVDNHCYDEIRAGPQGFLISGCNYATPSEPGLTSFITWFYSLEDYWKLFKN